MKRYAYILSALLVLFLLSGNASANTYTFNLGDLGDLDHYWAYAWGTNFNLPAAEKITGASIFFDDIRNWDRNPNILYVHLLDDPSPGKTIMYWDNQNGGDYFAGWTNTILLNQYDNLPAYAQDITYPFDAAEISTLTSYVADGIFGLGFDPDCHFYNSGISLTIQTAPIPEPSSVLLLGAGMGLLGLAAYRKKGK